MSNNNNKRRYVPPTQSDTVFRIISSAAKSDSLLSLSGDSVKILIEDYAGDPTSDDRIVVIISAATEQLPDESAAQLALIRVFERMVENDIEENSSKSLNSSSVGCRLLAPSYQVGCVLGRGGKIVEKIRQESGAQIRVLPKDQSPIPPPGDEFIQITGNFNAVKKALLAVSSCLQDNIGNSGAFKSSGGAQVEPYPQRGPHPPDHHHSRGYSSFPGSENAGPAHRMFVEEEVVYKMLCQQDKVGSLIGKGGSVVRALQNETGASIQIVDAGPDSDERVVVISALENSEQKHSPAQDAVIRVHCRLTEIGFEQSNAVVARLLVRSPQVGCLLGKGGHVISEMRRVTGASIRIFSKEQIKYISHNEEVVQVIGTLHTVQDALFHITSRIRESIFPMRNTPPNFSAPPHMPPFPETSPTLHRPRNHMMPSGHPHPPPPHVGPPPPPHAGPPMLPHGIDHPAGPPMHVDHPHAFSHGMGRGPPNMDRVSYPHGYEGPISPRSWNPQVVNRGNPGAHGMNGTVEITIPYMYIIHVYGESNSNINQIRQISGANVVIHDQKPGATEGLVIVSGTQDQIYSAQCLIHGFILCGQTAP
ncbi:hypothetical protein P8452_29892 [Trifolium repens]|nr:hypothetical protein P8452_29892 [Trifolium repens]